MSFGQIIQHMFVQAAFGGNFLLNIGPMANGDTYNCDEDSEYSADGRRFSDLLDFTAEAVSV